jgi:hypothetical protein
VSNRFRPLFLQVARYFRAHPVPGFRITQDPNVMDDITLFVVVALGVFYYFFLGTTPIDATTQVSIDVSAGLPLVTPGTPSAPPPPPVTPQPPVQPDPTHDTGDGSFERPFTPMSADPDQMKRDIRASSMFYGVSDDDYWFGLVNHVGGPSSDGYWWLGWNLYWETRMDPTNTGSADPRLARLPAVHRAA